MQRKFPEFQGPPQTFLDGLPLYGPNVHGRFEKLIALTPVFLGLVHGGICVVEQCFRILAIIGIDADANACGDVKVLLPDTMSIGHSLHHSSRRNGGIFRLCHFGQEYDEFVASLPAYRVRKTHTLHQTFSDGL